ncbi:DUF2141 domain-containing protein [Cecembia rubra]|uniref:Uncharacterized protein (DUF2141 family) n=1 Tax=Cecembia rubra TaxID=1485585 RepID=A0A2P8DW69_9BACT|nr:DUF2141 domain-containing protein [Cecembia rubra]PSL01417.1 uncharacterized protein (DUF2141 family) [Cecembia rubra]
MKTFLTFILMLFAVKTTQANNSLTLTVDKVKNEQGFIRVLLFKGETGFPDSPEKAYKSASIKIVGNKAVVTFENIPEGIYALSVFHDSQNTGKLRTNAFGIPRDGYGFSNDAMGTFGPPSFEKASFKVTASKNHVQINLR